VGCRKATGLILVVTALASFPSAEARSEASAPEARAVARAIAIYVPTQAAVVVGAYEAPSSSGGSNGSFAYPADGSVLQVGSVTGRATVLGALARASSDLASVSLFGGEITASAVVARSDGEIVDGVAHSDFGVTSLTNLVVLGQPITPSPNLRVPLGDWGHAILLEEQSVPSSATGPPSTRGWVTALDVWLDADHAGLPGGTRILLGYAEASVKGVLPPPPPVTTTTVPVTTTTVPETTPTVPVTTTTVPAGPVEEPQAKPRQAPKPEPRTQAQPRREPPPRPQTQAAPQAPAAPPPEPEPVAPPPPAQGVVTGPTTIAPQLPSNVLDIGIPWLRPPAVHPQLTAQGYVFPIYGRVAYGDSFGAFRADVAGQWHHGDDIFASLGAPVLAVADGTVFSVGPNRIGGNRLWLRDREGNEFYYAHLSAYTSLAKNGNAVHAGDVLGFVGNTGDASGGAYHLHFEVHPSSLLFLGYDGAVDPTSYLDAWRRLRDVSFPLGRTWTSRLRPRPGHSPTPGVILLQSTDISTASGLEPGSLARALAPSPAADDSARAGQRRLTRSRDS
jgi:murein DD-endopeptidase MepM/ murein hydrolase activator NlpD